MEPYRTLFAHNAWANARIFASLAAAPPTFLGEPSVGMTPVTSHFQRLQHLAFVEWGFLHALQGDPRMPEPPTSFERLVAFSRQTGEEFLTYCATLDQAAVASAFFVPWWEREFPRSVGLLQTLAHSAQHRAEVAWELANAAVDTGNLDYIVWSAQGEPKAGDPWPPPADEV